MSGIEQTKCRRKVTLVQRVKWHLAHAKMSSIGQAEVCGPIVLYGGTPSYRRKKTGKLRAIKISEALRQYLVHLDPRHSKNRS
jgi:hypothetical protein